MDLRGQLFITTDEYTKASQDELSAYQRQQAYWAAREAAAYRRSHPVIETPATPTTAVERALIRNGR
jgi:hypothetical protein